MTAGRVLLSLLLLGGGAADLCAQNSLNDFVARCGGAANVVDIGGGRLGCSAAPAGASASSMAGLGEAFMQLLRGLEADAQRRAAEQRARREMALHILQQHRNEALYRQDMARAQQLQEIEQRVARSETLFKGFTGAGAQLGVKTQSAGGLQMKMGRALAPRPASEPPAAAPAVQADAEAGITALRQAFEAVPVDEQLAILAEMHSAAEPELRDAPAAFAPKEAISVADLTPIQVPDGMTPELAKQIAKDEFEQLTGLDIEKFLNRETSSATTPASSGPPSPPPGGEVAPAPGTTDPCAHTGSDPETVNFCGMLDVLDRVVDPRAVRSETSDRRAPVGRLPPLRTRVEPRPLTKQELDLVQVAEPFDEREVFSRLARHRAEAPTQDERLDILRTLKSDAVSRYAMEPAYARAVDELIDRAVSGIRAERAEMELRTWDLSTQMLFTAINNTGLQNPDGAALLRHEGFVRERDRIRTLANTWRRQIQIVEERRLFQELHKGIWKIE